jgi:hypothetical protein
MIHYLIVRLIRQNYMPNTAILVTKLFDYHGNGMEVIDFCPRYTSYNRVYR